MKERQNKIILIQEHGYCRKDAGAAAGFYYLDIGYSVLNIGYSKYPAVQNLYGHSSRREPANSGEEA